MVNQQLSDYIKQQIKEGVSEGDIKKALLKNGWSDVDIDGALSVLLAPASVSSVPVPPPIATPSPSATHPKDTLSGGGQRQLNPRAVWLFFFNRVIPWTFASGYIASQIAVLASDIGGEPGNFFSGTFFVWFFIIFIVLMVLAYVVARLSYRFYKFELTDDGYRAERGIIWKRYVSIPYERIQNVDIYRGLLARLLGLSDLNIQTAGYGAAGIGAKGGGEGRLPGLSALEAEGVRDELIRRAKGAKQVI